MSDNNKYFNVTEYFEDGTSHTTRLLKEQAERLYSKIRAKGGIADLKVSVSKVVGI